MRNVALILCMCSIALPRIAPAGTEYFASTTTNAETGGWMGDDAAGDPLTWRSVHSQFNGTADHALRIGNMTGANWTFLWTRREGDERSYAVVPEFQVDKEYAGRIFLEVGFDPVMERVQVPWPAGYWVSNNSWCPAVDATQNAPGTETLSPEDGAIPIPSGMKRVYVRIRMAEEAASGFAFIRSGTVRFVPREDGDALAVGGGRRDILQLGADPRGQKDSTAAIQAALHKGGIVFIPAGTYRITDTLMLTRSGTEIRGETGSTLLIPAGSPITAIGTTQAFGVWHLSNLTIRDLTIVNDPANYSVGDNLQFTRGISLVGVVDTRVDNCTVKNFQHDGIYVGHSKRVNITGCQLEGARHGITVNGHHQGGRYGNWNIKINRCHTLDTWDTGIVVGFHSYYVSITDCTVERSRCHGIDIFNTSNVIVSNNFVRNWNSPHFEETTASSVGVFIHADWGISTAIPTRNITVTGNIIMFDALLPEAATKSIEVTGNTEGVIIDSNQLVGGYCAFFLRDQPRDQYFAARPDQREAETDTPRGVVFSRNVCRGQTGRYLWVSTSAGARSIVSGNVFTPAPQAVLDIRIEGGDSRVGGNIFNDDRLSAAEAGTLPAGVDWANNSVLPAVHGAGSSR